MSIPCFYIQHTKKERAVKENIFSRPSSFSTRNIYLELSAYPQNSSNPVKNWPY
jgi:hypothetical protein